MKYMGPYYAARRTKTRIPLNPLIRRNPHGEFPMFPSDEFFKLEIHQDFEVNL